MDNGDNQKQDDQKQDDQKQEQQKPVKWIIPGLLHTYPGMGKHLLIIIILIIILLILNSGKIHF